MAYPRRPRANPNWNAYRPDYSDNHQEAPVRRDYTYDRPSPPARLPPASTVMPAPYAYDDNDPNSIPVQPRRRVQQASPTPIRGTPDLSQDDGPQLWPAELDVMIGQVTRAYDVVINYERDCPNGKRWTTKGIRRVHEAGAYLHADVGVLRGWKRQAQELGTADEFMKRKIDEDWARVEKTCKKVRAAIDDEEKKARVIDGGYENGRDRHVSKKMRFAVEGGNERSGGDGGAVRIVGDLDRIDRGLRADWASTSSTTRRYAW